MKKLFIIIVVFVLSIISIHAKWHREMIGNTLTEVSCDPMTWIKMGGDINALDSLHKNVNFWYEAGQEYPTIGISKECAELLIWKFENEPKKKVLIRSGEKFDFEIYSGVWHIQKIRIAEITMGPIFDEINASAYVVEADDPIFNNHVIGFWFANELNGKKQCNNFCGTVRPIPKPEPVPIIQPEPEPQIPEPVIQPEPEPEPQIHEEPVNKYFCAHCWAWVSGATDLFGDPFYKIQGNQNGYQLFSYKTNDSGIYSAIGSLGGKFCFNKNLALIGTIDGGYQDGPYDWQSYVGLLYQFKTDNFIEGGWKHLYMEDERLEYESIDLSNGAVLERFRTYYIPLKENGVYLGYESLNKTGNNHFQLHGAQCLRDSGKLGTSNIRSSIKLEPYNLYLFACGGCQWTPSEIVDSLKIAEFDHPYFDLRAGWSITQNVIAWLGYGEIFHNQKSDHQNEESKYHRINYRLGTFYRPEKLLGIPNLYLEFLVGYSKIDQDFQYSMDTKDDVTEIKLTLFWNMMAKYLH